MSGHVILNYLNMVKRENIEDHFKYGLKSPLTLILPSMLLIFDSTNTFVCLCDELTFYIKYSKWNDGTQCTSQITDRKTTLSVELLTSKHGTNELWFLQCSFRGSVVDGDTHSSCFLLMHDFWMIVCDLKEIYNISIDLQFL